MKNFFEYIISNQVVAKGLYGGLAIISGLFGHLLIILSTISDYRVENINQLVDSSNTLLIFGGAFLGVHFIGSKFKWLNSSNEDSEESKNSSISNFKKNITEVKQTQTNFPMANVDEK